MSWQVHIGVFAYGKNPLQGAPEIHESVAGRGQAIFSGTCSETMADYVRTIFENTEVAEPQVSRLSYVLSQLTVINNARNALVHHGLPTYSAAGIVVAPRKSRLKNAAPYEFTVRNVLAMTADLGRIETELSFHVHDGEFDEYPAPLPSAWLYKSRQPNNTSKTNKAPGRRPHPPKSSRK